MCHPIWLCSRKYGTVWYHPASSKLWHLTALSFVNFQEKLTGTSHDSLRVWSQLCSACFVFGAGCTFCVNTMHETYSSFIYTLTCCYNSHVVLIMDAYVYNKFCKSRSCFALGQANDLKEPYVGKGPIFTNHVDKAWIMKKKKSCLKDLQDKSSTSPNPAMDAAVFINLRACSEV
jgi:hypothetical protein